MRQELKSEKQKEIVNWFKERKLTGKLFGATGLGKTKIGIDIIAEADSPITLWVCDTQLNRDSSVPNEIKKWNPEIAEFVTLICYQSLKKHVGKRYETIILDEGDLLTENYAQYLQNIRYENLVILSATKPNPERLVLLNEFAPETYTYRLDDAVDDGVLAPYEIYAVGIGLDNSDRYIEAGNRQKRFMTTEFKNYEFINGSVVRTTLRSRILQKRHDDHIRDMDLDGLLAGNVESPYLSELRSVNARKRFWLRKRLELIFGAKSKIVKSQRLIERLYSKDDRVLILTQRKEVANQLCKNRFYSGIPLTAFQKFNDKEINQLSACRSLDRGVNVNELDSVFIHQISASERQIVQRLGRAVRYREGHKAKIYIIYFVDTQDEVWVRKALADFDRTRIHWITYPQIMSKKNEYDKRKSDNLSEAGEV